MASVQKILGIAELTPTSNEDDARKTYDKWAATYEEVCIQQHWDKLQFHGSS